MSDRIAMEELLSSYDELRGRSAHSEVFSELMHNLIERDEDIYDSFAEFFSIPTISSLPRPGQAGSWSHRDWEAFLREQGFQHEGKSKHQHAWKHRVIRTWRIGLSTSPGDTKWSANAMQTTRNSLRVALAPLIGIAMNILSKIPLLFYGLKKMDVPETEEMRLLAIPSTRSLLFDYLQDLNDDREHGKMAMTRAMKLRVQAKGGEVADNVSDAGRDLVMHNDRKRSSLQATQDVLGLLKKLRNEFGLSPVGAFKQIGYDAATAQEGAVSVRDIQALLDAGKTVPSDRFFSQRLAARLQSFLDSMRESKTPDGAETLVEEKTETDPSVDTPEPTKCVESTGNGLNEAAGNKDLDFEEAKRGVSAVLDVLRAKLVGVEEAVTEAACRLEGVKVPAKQDEVGPLKARIETLENELIEALSASEKVSAQTQSISEYIQRIDAALGTTNVVFLLAALAEIRYSCGEIRAILKGKE